ncbi:hypothetical protein DPEC_G00361800 [Dallia pectoralis]|nr:hypothetical protein DPEC_G00361800 [Dallia pectoralis]
MVTKSFQHFLLQCPRSIASPSEEPLLFSLHLTHSPHELAAHPAPQCLHTCQWNSDLACSDKLSSLLPQRSRPEWTSRVPRVAGEQTALSHHVKQLLSRSCGISLTTAFGRNRLNMPSKKQTLGRESSPSICTVRLVEGHVPYPAFLVSSLRCIAEP